MRYVVKVAIHDVTPAPPFATGFGLQASKCDACRRYNVLRIFAIVVSTVRGLLWIRVFLEMVIVAFNISASINRIEHEAVDAGNRARSELCT